MEERIAISKFQRSDAGQVVYLWNQCADQKDIIYAPISENQFFDIFLKTCHETEEYMLIARDVSGHIVGFAAGLTKCSYLQGENAFNTSGYITMVLVSPDSRRNGIGMRLLNELESRFAAGGKNRAAVTYRNPMALTWDIPDTPGVQHNNAPGVRMDSPAFQMFLKNGFRIAAVEHGMYLSLRNFTVGKRVKEKQDRLAKEGIRIQMYDPEAHYGFEALFDALHGEVWRETIRENNKREKPLPVLIAEYEGRIVGFAGPIDKERNGRGWFNGIGVHPEFEHRGIATVLFCRLMEQFAGIGAEYSSLFTDEENPARKLYESVGFVTGCRFAVMEKEI